MEIKKIIAHRQSDFRLSVGKVSKESDNLKSDKPEKFSLYRQAYQIIDNMPFSINKDYYKLVAWQLNRVGNARFQHYVQAAAKARSPERYLMVCLKNDVDRTLDRI